MKSQINILLVEDCRAQTELIIDLLKHVEAPQCQVAPVVRIADAKAELSQQSFDVVLLDLNLPDSRDLEGFGMIHRKFTSVPIIILTNEGGENIAEQAMRQGAKDYLVKREVDSKLLVRSMRYAIERQSYENALLQSEERYALALSGAMDGLWDWDLQSGEIYFSPRWKEMLGFNEHELDHSIESWFKRVDDDDQDSLQHVLQAHLSAETSHFEHEHRIQKRDGEYVWVLVRGMAVRDSAGEAYRIAGSMTDISSRKEVEAQLVHDAMHDNLTNLPNRTLLMNRIEQSLKTFWRDNERLFAILYFDLDRFKNINDSLGHAAGDELLVAVSYRLNCFLRPGDTLARLGGDEFAILINDIDGLADVTNVAQRVNQMLNESFKVDGNTIYTSASVGIALSSDKYKWPQDMLRDADLAMYRCKQSTSSDYEIFDNDMHASAVALLKLETDLRNALIREEFVVHYQPIISMVTREISGFEALVRWQHPARGLLHPNQFITLAEETGLIVPMGWWVLDEACRQGKIWQEQYDQALSVSVNISGKVFMQGDMVEQLQQLLETHQYPATGLRLEITESAMMDHCDAALLSLDQLHKIGVELYIDDFGTGYSSLTYLQRFSYDKLKIDRSFVSRMQEEDDSNAIVKAIVGLGRMLGMPVIAEGVETAEQLESLREMECPEVQGYLFSHPADPATIETLLNEPHGLRPIFG